MRNLQMGYISPQFHVVFDELFTTVHSVAEDDIIWIELFTTERKYYWPTDDEEDEPASFPELDHEWLPQGEQILPTTPLTPTPTTADACSLITAPTPPLETDSAELSDVDEPPDESTPESTSAPVTRERRACKPNKRVFGPNWSTFTIRLTLESRTMLLGCIMPFSHDDLFIHSLDWDAPFRGSYTDFESINALHVDP
jgi:hypothetical protein